MVVCHCHVVSDRALRAEIASGALDADALAERCGAGTRCGGCAPVVEAILAEEQVRLRGALAAAAA
jgi:bacterioferritin-associated ferredoxin